MSRNVTGEAEPGPLRLQFEVSVKLAFQGSSISSDGGLLLYRELDDAVGLLNSAGHCSPIQTTSGRLAGYEDVNDANRLHRDPVMRQLVGGRTVKHGAAWNGHFQSKCLHPLFVFNQFGDLERCTLRLGNVHSTDGWEGVLRPMLSRYSSDARPSIIRRRFRADAAFAMPALFDLPEAEGWDYAIRIKSNQKLYERISWLTKRRPGASSARGSTSTTPRGRTRRSGGKRRPRPTAAPRLWI